MVITAIATLDLGKMKDKGWYQINTERQNDQPQTSSSLRCGLQKDLLTE